MRHGIVLTLATFLMASGCAEKPVLDLLEAQETLAAARDAEADLYAPEEYDLAVSNLQNAIAAIDRQEEEPLWARSYAFAGDLLALSIEQSQAAIAVSENIRQEASFQVDLLIPELEETIDQAFFQLGQARETNVVSRREIDTLDADLAIASQLLREARTNRDREDFVVAMPQVQQALELADRVRIRSEEINVLALEVQLELEQQNLPALENSDPFAP
jgi:hypothetical protein